MKHYSLVSFMEMGGVNTLHGMKHIIIIMASETISRDVLHT